MCTCMTVTTGCECLHAECDDAIRAYLTAQLSLPHRTLLFCGHLFPSLFFIHFFSFSHSHTRTLVHAVVLLLLCALARITPPDDGGNTPEGPSPSSPTKVESPQSHPEAASFLLFDFSVTMTEFDLVSQIAELFLVLMRHRHTPTRYVPQKIPLFERRGILHVIPSTLFETR
jgi:hypothetical protein